MMAASLRRASCFLLWVASLRISAKCDHPKNKLSLLKPFKSFPSAAILAAASIVFSASTVSFAEGGVPGGFSGALADVGVREFLVKDGKQLLRLNQPVLEGDDSLKLGPGRNIGKTIQEDLELIRLRLEQVGVTNPSAWGKVLVDETEAETLFGRSKSDFIKQSNDETAASRLVDDVITQLAQLKEFVKSKNGMDTLRVQEKVASDFSRLRLMLVQKPGLKWPYQIPDEYASLPRLNGYATVELKVASKSGAGFRLEDGKTVAKEATFTITVDGYHAPLTAGNFVDLVDKKFYDGMDIQKSEQLIVQTGKPANGGEGYIEPGTKKIREIPLELFYKRDSEPVYGITSDDDARATDTMALPFQAYGAVGMARDNEQADSASSQFFFLKWKQALIAPGRNTLDGFYSCFGYITSPNEYLLGQITTADKIVYAKVIDGLQNLKR